jgi:transcriptional regulator with XRE-family HTH domain
MSDYIVARIVSRRNALKWSQERLAQELQLLGLDLSRSAVNNLEQGNRRLEPNEIPYFAAALGVDPNWIVDWEEFRKQKN